MVRFLEENSDYSVVFPDFYIVDEAGVVTGQEHRHDFENEVTLFDQPAHGACTMVKKSVLDELGGYSEEFNCQDGFELWIRVIDRYKVSNINLPLFYYRQHGKNLTKNTRRLLGTRCDIVRKHVEVKQIVNSVNWSIIPIRIEQGSNQLALKRVNGKTLLDITIEQLTLSVKVEYIILTTNDKHIYEYAKNIKCDGLVIDWRPDSISSLNVPIEKTIKYLLEKYKNELSGPDVISIVNYEYPLRDPKYIDMLIDVINLFGADSSLSVSNCKGNLYKHDGGGLVGFSTNNNLRLERDVVYEDCGGLHATKCKSFEETGMLMSGKTTHILLDEYSSLKVCSEVDLKIADFLSKDI